MYIVFFLKFFILIHVHIYPVCICIIYNRLLLLLILINYAWFSNCLSSSDTEEELWSLKNYLSTPFHSVILFCNRDIFEYPYFSKSTDSGPTIAYQKKGGFWSITTFLIYHTFFLIPWSTHSSWRDVSHYIVCHWPSPHFSMTKM